MPLYLDVWEMEDEYRLAEQTEDREKKIAHFMRAWELYRGELLPQLASEGWVIVESIRLKQLYEEMVRRLRGPLRAHRDGTL